VSLTQPVYVATHMDVAALRLGHERTALVRKRWAYLSALLLDRAEELGRVKRSYSLLLTAGAVLTLAILLWTIRRRCRRAVRHIAH